MMKKNILFFLAISAALILETSLRPLLNLWLPPFFLWMISLVFWKTDIYNSLFLAAFFGLLADTLSFFPFGTFLLLLFPLVFLASLLKSVFTNPDSRLTRSVVLGMMILISSALIYPLGVFLSYTKDIDLVWNWRAEIILVSQGAVWALILPFVSFKTAFSIRKKIFF